jgi:hypothetical protein
MHAQRAQSGIAVLGTGFGVLVFAHLVSADGEQPMLSVVGKVAGWIVVAVGVALLGRSTADVRKPWRELVLITAAVGLHVNAAMGWGNSNLDMGGTRELVLMRGVAGLLTISAGSVAFWRWCRLERWFLALALVASVIALMYVATRIDDVVFGSLAESRYEATLSLWQASAAGMMVIAAFIAWNRIQGFVVQEQYEQATALRSLKEPEIVQPARPQSPSPDLGIQLEQRFIRGEISEELYRELRIRHPPR